MVDNRGTIVWPGGMAETFVTDSYRCRFQPAASATSQAVTHAQISALYQKVTAAGYDIVKTETLRTFDGQQGFTLAQGQ
jgi:isocitrate dehydrogenase